MQLSNNAAEANQSMLQHLAERGLSLLWSLAERGLERPISFAKPHPIDEGRRVTAHNSIHQHIRNEIKLR